jgi:hypothetical protein
MSIFRSVSHLTADGLTAAKLRFAARFRQDVKRALQQRVYR